MARITSVLVSHLGYNSDAPMAAVIAGDEPGMTVSTRLIRLSTAEAWDLPAVRTEAVDGWSTGYYARVDLGVDRAEGEYVLEASLGASRDASRAALLDASRTASLDARSPDDGESTRSAPFTIGQELLQGRTLSDVLYYFKSMRSSGEIERKDAAALRWGDDSGVTVDARGGWLDASGDTSKFLSHLTYTPMMSPQQLPFCAWAFLEAREQLATVHPRFNAILAARLRDEALWGADFLVRFRHPDGYFYTGIFDALTKRLEERVVTAPLPECVRTDRYQASYRAGGGLAIAALARASRESEHGDFSQQDYLDAARTAFDDLEKNNLRYLHGLAESITDDYCALLAASELACAEDAPRYTAAAERRAAALMARYTPEADEPGYFVGYEDGRPFFHAAEAGLPVVALLRFAEVLPKSKLAEPARTLALRAMRDVAARSDAVPNPFGYPRQRVKATGSPARDSFFFPHDNDTGYWWQGENASIASLAFAAAQCARLPGCDDELRARLLRLASDPLFWVLGQNPFDVGMLQGRGRNNVEYSVEFPNVPGGIVNGITSGLTDESDIGFLPPGTAHHDDSWRWAEQWIPHTAWFVLAMSVLP